MSNVETTMAVPLTITEFGTIRVGHSGVSLDSVVHHYKLGATAERIAESFPSLDLADIYAVIAYYLANRESVEEYLRRQEAEADALQQQMESDPSQQNATNQLRERIRARWATRQATTGSFSDSEALKLQLMANDAQFADLVRTRTEYERRLSELADLHNPSVEEQMEEATLKRALVSLGRDELRPESGSLQTEKEVIPRRHT
jgi:uncharacterized protein (DUF433 family)